MPITDEQIDEILNQTARLENTLLIYAHLLEQIAELIKELKEKPKSPD